METEAAIAVLGATGNQGGHVARVLRAAGLPVHALTRNPGSVAAQGLKAAGCTLIAADMEDPASLLQALSGAAAVFSVQNVWDFGSEKEVRLGTTVIEAARRAGVPHFVYASGLGAERPRGLQALDGKAELERRLAASGIPFTILRPALFVDDFFGASIPFRGPVRRFAERHRPLVGRLFLAALEGFVASGASIPVASLSDLARTAHWAFSHPPGSSGRILPVVSTWTDLAELRRLYTAATGIRPPHVPFAGAGLSVVHPDMAALLRFLVSLEPDAVERPLVLPPLSEWFQRFSVTAGIPDDYACSDALSEEAGRPEPSVQRDPV